MEAIAVTVGIDVSKDRLDVHVRGREEGSREERFDVPRDTEGISALAERLRALAPGAIGLEATGGLEAVVAASLAAAGLPVVVVNPAQVRAAVEARDGTAVEQVLKPFQLHKRPHPDPPRRKRGEGEALHLPSRL